MTDPNDPAFPVQELNGAACFGLTKRELFSILILNGMITAQTKEGFYRSNSVAEAIACADELIKQLNHHGE